MDAIQGILQRLAALEARYSRTEVMESFKTVLGYAATTDATVTTVATITIPASTTVLIEVHVAARRTGGVAGTAEDGAGYVVRGTYKNVAGTATLIGSLNLDYTAESQAGWDATLTVSGATVLVRATGAVNNNISWLAVAELFTISS